MKPPGKAAQREARLAARLKENLARRKDQARSRDAETPAAPRSEPRPRVGSREK
jgi:hypothetical protein